MTILEFKIHQVRRDFAAFLQMYEERLGANQLSISLKSRINNLSERQIGNYRNFMIFELSDPGHLVLTSESR